ncbi:MAG: hypothetical protein H8E35_14000 [Ardenticatenia bacterium]|nr:hypothetical protein [Ardenticatenia bacterium]
MSQTIGGAINLEPEPGTVLHSLGTAEAFYRVFCALPQKERIVIAHYILADQEVQQSLALSEIPNETTLQAFAEDKQRMPVFATVDELGKDLLS